MKYNHAFDIAFSVIGTDSEGNETPEALLTAIIDRALRAYNDGELIEACGAPFDTFEIKD